MTGPFYKVPQMETCSWCRGYGMVSNGDSVSDCTHCWGSGEQEKRDAKGRFLPWLAIPVAPYRGDQFEYDQAEEPS